MTSVALLAAFLGTVAPAQHAPCQVTAPNHSAVPDAIRGRAGVPATDPFRHGNGALWTSLWPNGAIVIKNGGPGNVLADGSLRMKFLWVLASDGPLSVTGRRLDGDARPLTAEIAAGFVGRGFQPSYLVFPTAGCWEVTAQANGSSLTFVTTVDRQGQ